MLDESVVLTPGISHGLISLNAIVPDVILDGGAAGATAKVLSGPVLMADVGNDCQLAGAWATVAKGQTVTVAAGKRAALRDGGSSGGTVLSAPAWS